MIKSHPYLSNFFSLVLFVYLANQTNTMKSKNTYWKTNLKYLVILLSIWFSVSFGFGILMVDQLNQIQMAGFKIGFWFAQQGAIYVFVILIFVYIYLMNRLDQKFKKKF